MVIKKIIKYVVSFCFLCLIGVILPKEVYAGDGWGSFGDQITWTFTESTGVLELKGSGEMPEEDAPWHSYNNEIQKVIIGEGITSVSGYLFDGYAWGCQSYYKKLHTVELPSTMKRIGERAFYDCESLSKINFPEGLEKIGSLAFRWTSLTKVEIPGTVAEIESSAFTNCGKLVEIKLNEGVNKIGDGCFSYTKISKLQIPTSVTIIGRYAFENCDYLIHVEIPLNVEKLGEYAFAECDLLRYIKVDAAVDLEFGCFNDCKVLEVVKLGEKVKSIDGSFRRCSALKAVYAPKSITRISDDAFWFWGGPTDLSLYGYGGTTAWEYVGKTEGIDFVDMSTATGRASWDKLWEECVNRGNQKGDINQDGNINLTDARIVLRAALKLQKLSADENSRADVNQDSRVNLTDARLILRYALRIINEFPK